MIEKPIRKYQKQKDYQKHKILRRIKKRNQRRKEAASKIAERALRKKLKLPAFEGGKDEDQLLIGGYVAPELVVTPEGNTFRTTESGQPAVSTGALLEAGIPIRRKSKELKNNQKLQGHDEYLAQQAKVDEKVNKTTPSAEQLFNIATVGGFNNLSPTQWARRVYDTGQLINGNMSLNEYMNKLYFGNNGIASNEYARKHPYRAMAANLVGDIATFGTSSALLKMPSWYRAMQAENQMAQDIVANNWRNITSNATTRSDYIPIGDNKYWFSSIPADENYAYRIMEQAEVDDLMAGNELRTASSNPKLEAIREQQKAALKEKRFSLFKSGQEHGGRKQFAKGEPWGTNNAGTTVTHGEKNYLAMPGHNLPWYGGRHNKVTRGQVSFEDAPFGSHIDLLTEDGLSGVNPSKINNSFIFSPESGGYIRKNVISPQDKPSTISWEEAVKSPQITPENAASMTPEQWTIAQDAAIARGDIAEAQRLRDLHFQVSAPNTVTSVNGQPLQLYHGTNNTFNAFDLSKYGKTDAGTFGRGVYTTPVKEYAELYGENNMPLYMKLDNPRDYRNYSIGDLIAEKIAFGDDFATGIGIDGVIGRPSWKGFKGLEEYVSHNPKNIKSSFPITYDDKGVRIPLGERDNFNINDIRYGLIPFGTGLTGYGLYNNVTDPINLSYNKGKDPIRIKPSKRGTFTAAAKKRGMGVQQFASKVLKNPSNYSLAMRKKAQFAKNATKFKH